jgi:hypothetical protein
MNEDTTKTNNRERSDNAATNSKANKSIKKQVNRERFERKRHQKARKNTKTHLAIDRYIRIVRSIVLSNLLPSELLRRICRLLTTQNHLLFLGWRERRRES